MTTPAEFWEQRYAGSGAVWSGRVNATMAEVVSGLVPGTALDLGCGEGGDALWLAEHGWQVTAVDISATAVERGVRAAAGRGLTGIDFQVADLTTWQPPGHYDLVTASFLQSPVELATAAILRRAALRLNPGGHLLVVAHAAPPPWSAHLHEHHHQFSSATEQFAQLDLGDGWRPVLAETRRRSTVGPDGQPAELDDTVLLVERG